MLLNAEIQESVKQAWAGMTEPVMVKLFLKSGEESSQTMQELWNELSTLSPMLAIEESTQSPSGMTPQEMEGAVSEIWRGGQFTGVRYLGIPSGHEFGPFIETLLEVSQGAEPGLTADASTWLQALKDPLHLQVFVTPT